MNDNFNAGCNKGAEMAQKFLDEVNAHIQQFKDNKDYIGGFHTGVLAAIGADLYFYDGEFFCSNTEDV